MSMIFKKMIELKKSIDHIEKDQVNKGQGFKFRSVDQIYNEIHNKAALIGIFTIPEVLESTCKEGINKNGNTIYHVILKIKYTFYAEDGSNLTSIVYGEAIDTGDKAHNKCMSIAHKYCLLQTFMIPTEDTKDESKDPDSESHEIARPQLKSIKIENKNNDRQKFLKSLGLAFKNADEKKQWLTDKKILSNEDISNLSDDDLIGLTQELNEVISSR